MPENKTKRLDKEGSYRKQEKKDSVHVDNVTVVDTDADGANNQC